MYANTSEQDSVTELECGARNCDSLAFQVAMDEVVLYGSACGLIIFYINVKPSPRLVFALEACHQVVRRPTSPQQPA